MNVVILAGGKGRRMCAESSNLPKPLVEIGDKPILWHVMHSFSLYGHSDFVIALGYQAKQIRQVMIKQLQPDSCAEDLTETDECCYTLKCRQNGWTVQFIETGIDTQTGGRIKRIKPYLTGTPFFLTWCDGLADINLDEIASFHQEHDRLVTMATVHPRSRFGIVRVTGNKVTSFTEKPTLSDMLVNSGYCIVDTKAVDYIRDDQDAWETGPIQRLIRDNQLMAWYHEGNWQCMDTVNDWEILQDLWISGSAFWSSKNK